MDQGTGLSPMEETNETPPVTAEETRRRSSHERGEELSEHGVEYVYAHAFGTAHTDITPPAREKRRRAKT